MSEVIMVGGRLPDTAFTAMGPAGPEIRTTADVFFGRSVALFAVPGAYTPVCHRQHLPGIIALADVLRRQGIDTVACTAVNDVYVLDQWSKDHNASGRVLMLADGNAEFALKTGLAVDLSRFGLGVRSNRYVMVVADGTVKILSVEESLMSHERSSAKTLCELMSSSERAADGHLPVSAPQQESQSAQVE